MALLLLGAVLLLSGVPSPHADGCKSDADCSLNGVCTPRSTGRSSGSGICVCDKGWDGGACSTLSLAPAIKTAGLQSRDNSLPTSSWGGFVDALPADDGGGGSYGMIAAQMVLHITYTPWEQRAFLALRVPATVALKGIV